MFHSSHLQGHRGSARVEDAQETPAQSHISPSILQHTKIKLHVRKPGRGGRSKLVDKPHEFLAKVAGSCVFPPGGDAWVILDGQIYMYTQKQFKAGICTHKAKLAAVFGDLPPRFTKI